MGTEKNTVAAGDDLRFDNNLKVNTQPLSVDLNTLGPEAVGIYFQNVDKSATAANHYPHMRSGSLFVLPSAYGVQQQYNSYSMGLSFIRGLVSKWNGLNGPWGEWVLAGDSVAPVGIPMPWPTPTPPEGWLKCNGSPFDKSKYPQLALAYPAGYLPDLRGEFIRGWDDGRGADNNRALLSAQLGTAFPSMYVYATSATRGTLVTQPISAFGDKFPIEGKPVDTEGVENTPSSGAYFSTGELSPTGSSSLIKYRVRPRNIAFNYIVRAA
ncbi:tail fiber protein [Yersinia ruckeri]|nr:tail fiber protein [Yersinia ruckeri]